MSEKDLVVRARFLIRAIPETDSVFGVDWEHDEVFDAFYRDESPATAYVDGFCAALDMLGLPEPDVVED